MLSSSTISVFVAASLLYAVIPGPNIVYIVTRGIGQGRRAAIVSALGVETGSLVHVAAAAAGVSALLAASAAAFNAVKYAGAAYLIYLGIKTLRGGPAEHLTAGVAELPRARLRRIYLQAVVVDVLNPKSALFYMAFLPQFIHAGHGARLTQILMLAAIVFVIGTASDMFYALAAGTVGRWLRRRPRFLSRQHYVTGGIYITLGLAAAFVGAHRQAVGTG